MKFEAEDQEFAKFLRSLEKIIQTVKGQNKNAFLTCSWSFLRSNVLEQFDFKFEKIIVTSKSAGKVKKRIFPLKLKIPFEY